MLSPALGSSSGIRRWSPTRGGVWPPRLNQAVPSTTVRPAARMLMATPLTTWLPRWVIQAKPCSSAITSAAAMAAATPSQAEPVTAEVAAAQEADIDDAALLREQPAHGTQDQRRRHPQCGGEGQKDDRDELVHHDTRLDSN